MNKWAAPTCLPFVLILFGLPFLGVGIGITRSAVRMWRLRSDMAHWPQVPATITHAKLGMASSEGTSYYRVTCNYSYVFKGRKYAGSQVDINESSSSWKDQHQRRYEILRQHQEGGRRFQAYLNPRAPEQAILFREPDQWMYISIPFGLVFAMAGLGVEAVAASLLLGRRRRPRPRGGHGDPDADAPWLARRDWQECRPRSSAGVQMAGSWIAGIFLGLFMSVAVFAIGAESDIGKVVGGVLALSPALVLLHAVRLRRVYAVHGIPQLILAQVPARPGDMLHARLRVSRRTLADAPVSAVLTCSRRVRTSSESSTDQELIRQEAAVTPLLGGLEGGTWVSVAVAIPEDAREEGSHNPPFRWQLKATVRLLGASASPSFSIPVFRASDAQVRHRPMAGTCSW